MGRTSTRALPGRRCHNPCCTWLRCQWSTAPCPPWPHPSASSPNADVVRTGSTVSAASRPECPHARTTRPAVNRTAHASSGRTGARPQRSVDRSAHRTTPGGSCTARPPNTSQGSIRQGVIPHPHPRRGLCGRPPGPGPLFVRNLDHPERDERSTAKSANNRCEWRCPGGAGHPSIIGNRGA